MTSSDELLVVGGGIGGLSAALSVAHTGRPVRVLERATEFGEIGAGLQLAPNATRVLDRLGLLERVIDAGVLPDRLVFGDALTGHELTRLEFEDFPRRYGAPYVVLHRSDLLDILVDACRERGVALETGKHVVEIENTTDHVVAHCQDGSRYRGGAAVGADGLRSGTRKMLSDDEPTQSGFVAYRGAIPVQDATRPAELTEVVIWIGPGLHFVQYPLRRGEIYNQVAVFRSPGYAAGRDDWGEPDELDEAFSVTCEHVREAKRSLWRDQHWSMHDREPLDNWLTGRTVLLGDAAHPMLQYLAQGACQAIEDAEVLARCLEQHDSPQWDKALRAYQEERIPRTAEIQRVARVWGDIWHVDGLAAMLRNEVFTQRRHDDHRHIEWLYGGT
ncbi:MAG: FAD-binding protein [Pseudonocardiaceae bacterium]|nr:FAD-binding protein [Pseudonocardiaceae bacterium]